VDSNAAPGCRFPHPPSIAICKSGSRRRPAPKELESVRPDLVHVVRKARSVGLGDCGGNDWAYRYARTSIRISQYSRHYGSACSPAPCTLPAVRHNRADCHLVPTAQMRANSKRLAFERVAVVGAGWTRGSSSGSPQRAIVALPGLHRQRDRRAARGAHRAREESRAVLDAAWECRRSTRSALCAGRGRSTGAALRNRHPESFSQECGPARIWRSTTLRESFLFPSVTETFGNVTIEAMASGPRGGRVRYQGPSSICDNGANGACAQGRYAEFIAMAAQARPNGTLDFRSGWRPARRRGASWTGLRELERVLRIIAGTVRADPTHRGSPPISRLESGWSGCASGTRRCASASTAPCGSAVCRAFRASAAGDGDVLVFADAALLAFDGTRASLRSRAWPRTGLSAAPVQWLKSKPPPPAVRGRERRARRAPTP